MFKLLAPKGLVSSVTGPVTTTDYYLPELYYYTVTRVTELASQPGASQFEYQYRNPCPIWTLYKGLV